MKKSILLLSLFALVGADILAGKTAEEYVKEYLGPQSNTSTEAKKFKSKEQKSKNQRARKVETMSKKRQREVSEYYQNLESKSPEEQADFIEKTGQDIMNNDPIEKAVFVSILMERVAEAEQKSNNRKSAENFAAIQERKKAENIRFALSFVSQCQKFPGVFNKTLCTQYKDFIQEVAKDRLPFLEEIRKAEQIQLRVMRIMKGAETLSGDRQVKIQQKIFKMVENGDSEKLNLYLTKMEKKFKLQSETE